MDEYFIDTPMHSAFCAYYEKMTGRNKQTMLGTEIGVVQCYVSQMLRGVNSTNGEPLRISWKLMKKVCDLLEMPYPVGETRVSRKYNSKSLYLAVVSPTLARNTTLGVKFGIQLSDDDARIRKLDTEKPQYHHALLAKYNFKETGIACTVEKALIEKFGKNPEGEYAWIDPSDAIGFLDELSAYWDHEKKLAV